MIWRSIPYEMSSPAWNMACDEAIFLNYIQGKAPPTIRFYGWNPPTLSIGFFQDVEREVDLKAIQQKGLGLVRRNTGGRAVLHHYELTYSVVAGSNIGLPNSLIESYLYISRAFVAACEYFGIKADLHRGTAGKVTNTAACFETPSWYELTVGHRKLVGSAQLRQHGFFLQHGSILLDFNAAELAAVLMAPVSKPVFATQLEAKITSFRKLGLEVEPRKLGQVIV